MSTATQTSDGGNSTIRPYELVDVTLPDGSSTIGIVVKVYAENHCVIAYTERGQRKEKMVYVRG